MKRTPPHMVAAALLAVVPIGSCSTRTREPVAGSVRPAPGVLPASEAKSESGRPRRYGEADAQFMQQMIGHHAQALAMTRLVPARSTRDDLRLLAERIEVSQQGEMTLMERWLKDRGADVPSPEAHQHHEASAGAGHGAGGHEALMPGMLTAEELAQLTKATGAEFDRLFLRFMIRHHEGALTMVARYFATPGAGQDTEAFRLASDVDADQRAEIGRMRTMQAPR